MDQVKIGKFISERRKILKLTQSDLAEKLNITDRAVSKWERGISMPDASIMLELCSLLKITVNDLLSGGFVEMENYDKELEKNLILAIKEKEDKDKRLLAIEWVLISLSLILLFIPIVLVKVFQPEEWQGILIILSGAIPCLIGLFFALRIEQVAGYYECKYCGHKHVPTFKSALFAMHMGRIRYLKCPNCGKRSWQKKVISK